MFFKKKSSAHTEENIASTLPSLLAHVDTPSQYPRATLFKISGWVASHSKVDSVQVGSMPMTLAERPDVSLANSNYANAVGFSGLARESDIDNQSVVINVLSNNSINVVTCDLGVDVMLSLSKHEKLAKLKSLFPDDDPIELIESSRSTEVDNDDISKFEWIKPILKCPKCHQVGVILNGSQHYCSNNHDVETIGNTYVYLDAAMKAKHNITNNTDTASRAQDPLAVALIGKFKDGHILDCGSGLPFQNYKNVVNFEIQKFSNTDVVGVGEELPFADNSFDAVFSFSVLEHVKNPFQCAAEIERVLKPGGVIYTSVPFLIPVHGYPHHYYNMTQQGLKNLFSKGIHIHEEGVPISGHPLFTLNSVCNIWNTHLSEADKEEFKSLTLGEIMDDPAKLISKSLCANLPQDIQSLISCTNMVLAQKKSN